MGFLFLKKVNKMIEENKIYLGDSLDFMRQMPDKSVDLVLADPPYGMIGANKKRGRFRCGRFKKYYISNDETHWDFAPDKEYFSEIFRISKNQIIWGG